MRTFFTIIILFLAITGASTLLINFFNVDFGTVDYWDRHGYWLLFFLATFPRLTLLFSSIPFGGLFWWIGFFFAPRVLVAILATIGYWHTNPLLVIASWLFAISGESSEKYFVQKKVVVIRNGPKTFEAEYTIKD